jgi:hypothetical protein
MSDNEFLLLMDTIKYCGIILIILVVIGITWNGLIELKDLP